MREGRNKPPPAPAAFRTFTPGNPIFAPFAAPRALPRAKLASWGMAFLLACFGGGRVAVAPHSDGPPTWQQHLHRHFHLLKTLGQGGYSIVYRVLRRADGCEYALKVTDLGRLTPWSRLAAVREVQVLAGLAAHPCITTFREAFCVGSRLCIVTDLADGGDLKRRIE